MRNVLCKDLCHLTFFFNFFFLLRKKTKKNLKEKQRRTKIELIDKYKYLIEVRLGDNLNQA